MSDYPPVCDICGATATNWARDIIRHEVPGEPWVQARPGALHSGCDVHHTRERVQEYRTQLPPDREEP